MYLLDTSIISELRRVRPHGAVKQWFANTAEQVLHIAGVTIGEIQAGIEVTRETDLKRANELEEWLIEVTETYNVLPMDSQIFRIWAKLMHRQPSHLQEDAMIAATAKHHKLTIVTRNTKDFGRFGVKLFNPYLKA